MLVRGRWAGVALLLEIMLGLALVAIAFLFVLRLFPAADQSVAEADRMAQATQVARQQLELALSKGYFTLAPVTGNTTVTHASRRGANESLTFSYQVDVVPLPSPTQIKDVTCTVTWTTGTGSSTVQRKVVLETQKGSMW